MGTITAKMARTDQSKVPASGIDRLSSLPDEIISHILSFRPTKLAVGTAILSRRWKDLWTCVPNLDFDNRLVYRYLNSSGDADDLLLKEMETERALVFCRFVDRVLSQHNNLDSLRRFHFHFSASKTNWEVMQEYLDRRGLAFGSQVEEIAVELREASQYGTPHCIWHLPESFYTLKNLRVVKLDGVIMGVNGSVSLPSLKILQLWNVFIGDLESLSRLISGSPVLEDLCLEHCGLVEMNEEDTLIASMPSLRSLRIGFFYNGDDRWLCPIVMEAPKLEHLYLETFTELQFKGSGSHPLPCLHSAKLDIRYSGSSYDDLITLLTQISNAKELYLYGSILGFLLAGDDVQRLVFPDLTHLTIQPTIYLSESCSGWILHSLLHSAPKLQSLVINMFMAQEPMKWEGAEPTSTPQCLLSSLEEIEITGYGPFRIEMKMIGYLLSAGAMLKR